MKGVKTEVLLHACSIFVADKRTDKKQKSDKKKYEGFEVDFSKKFSKSFFLSKCL